MATWIHLPCHSLPNGSEHNPPYGAFESPPWDIYWNRKGWWRLFCQSACINRSSKPGTVRPGHPLSCPSKHRDKNTWVSPGSGLSCQWSITKNTLPSDHHHIIPGFRLEKHAVTLETETNKPETKNHTCTKYLHIDVYKMLYQELDFFYLHINRLMKQK